MSHILFPDHVHHFMTKKQQHPFTFPRKVTSQVYKKCVKDVFAEAPRQKTKTKIYWLIKSKRCDTDTAGICFVVVLWFI